MKLQGLRVAVLGGDERELVLIPELIRLGAKVVAVGFVPSTLVGAQVVDTVAEAVEDAQVIILPMSGTDEHGIIRAPAVSQKLELTEKIIKSIPVNTPIIIGVVRPFLQNLADRYRLKLIKIAAMDDLAIYNSIPSAEGALQIAMENTRITIHGSRSWVLGFGRVGQTLARMLQGIGAKTTVCARNPADHARIWECGYESLDYNRILGRIHEAEIIFNTVPAMILDQKVLSNCNPEVLIVDLASVPGGTDFVCAEALGIKAILAPSLPGKVAPRTAGKILSQVIPRLISEAIREQEEQDR